MPWTELSIRAKRREWVHLEAALQQVGALSVTLLDAQDDPILEPGVGAMPLWRELIVQALFASDVDRRGLAAVLQELVHTLDGNRLTFRDVADSDWTRAWMDDYQPMRFGQRLWVYPSNIDPPAQAESHTVVRLDPGLAFGTGTHPTTALCLEWLDALPLSGKRVLDYGCGSGILAISALKLGAVRATGIDNDPQALLASRSNACANQVDDALALYAPGDWRPEPHDVVLANILANQLIALAPLLAGATRAGGSLALSGILPEQAQEITARYQNHFDNLEVRTRDGWVCVTGCRNTLAWSPDPAPVV